MALTPQGHFEGSTIGLENMYYSNGIKTKTLDEFPKQFLVKGLIQKALNGEKLPELSISEGFNE